MKIAVARETREGESRVAMVPELVAKLTALGHDVAVEPGAGAGAQYADEEYVDAGAEVSPHAFEGAGLIVSVNALDAPAVRQLAEGTATLSFVHTNQAPELVADLRDCGITAFAMELVPRISRAQSMDALSSQALVAGYRSAIVAAGMLRRFFPLNMTAAGTVPPAQVVVLGAGVAGLQAIATAKRLGAVVKAYDVRAASAEEIRSLGAVAIDLELETLEGTGGYAREMTADRAATQREKLTPYIAEADALITTAAVPGRAAPMLVTADMVERMKPGSVVVDLAAETGGNVEGSVRRRGRADRPRAGLGRAERALAAAAAGLEALRPEHRQHRHADDPRGRASTPTSRTRSSSGRASPTAAASCTSPPARPSRAPARNPAPHRSGRSRRMSEGVVWLTIFILSVFVGVEVISKVSSTLHTPLMSGANAIHGVILLGAILVTGSTDDGLAIGVGLVAIVLATINMVGGFVVTDRMLQMFSRRKPAKAAKAGPSAGPTGGAR